MTVELSIGLRSFAADGPGPDGWDVLTTTARMVERAGVDRVVVSDHVAFGGHMDAYARPELGGRSGGRQPTGPDGHWLEPLTVLTWVAARTERLRLGTNILLAGLRPAVVLAKTAATLDVLSGGRLDLGVGVGWQREEYDAAGVDFARRGAVLDEALEVCHRLWTEAEVSHDGPALRFEGIHQMPKPLQPGGVPIWVSGTVNPRVARRLARFGRGWIPWGPAAADLPAAVPAMRAAVAEAGGDADFGVVGTLAPVHDEAGRLDPAATAAPAAGLVAAGVTDLRLPGAALGGPDPEAAEPTLTALVEALSPYR